MPNNERSKKNKKKNVKMKPFRSHDDRHHTAMQASTLTFLALSSLLLIKRLKINKNNNN